MRPVADPVVAVRVVAVRVVAVRVVAVQVVAAQLLQSELLQPESELLRFELLRHDLLRRPVLRLSGAEMLPVPDQWQQLVYQRRVSALVYPRQQLSAAGGNGSATNATATTLFGGDTVTNGPLSGMRVRLGYWFDDCQTCGLEGSFFFLGPCARRTLLRRLRCLRQSVAHPAHHRQSPV